MAFVVADSVPWHDGEQKIHNLLRIPRTENPTAPCLTPGAAYLLSKSPLLALGTLDKEGRPWSTIWGGEAGFAGQIAQSIIGIRALVDRANDPVVGTLLGDKADGEVVKEEGGGRMVSGLTIDLETRKRVKLYGRMVVGSMAPFESDEKTGDLKDSGTKGKVQLVLKIEESLGNCPKYLNKKQITSALPEPRLVSNSPQLPQQGIDLLNRADCLFVSSCHHTSSMDTNIRGGSPGFARVISNDPSGAVLIYPEYSGNRLYQTLGNLQATPLAGYVFPDFETGDALYATGTVEILVGKDAAALLPRSNLAVKVTITAARYVEKSLAFRGTAGQPSPYNPAVRYLSTEQESPFAQGSDEPSATALLVKKEELAPSINRFRFRISDPSRKIGRWSPGQYAIFSFKDELDMGYSHMRDDDPTSINDDYVRAFTVSSYPGRGLPDDEFEVTVRKHGNATSLLFRSSERHRLEIPLKGFGGSFRFENKTGGVVFPFIAGGIGITPLLAQLPGIDISRLHLLWSVSVKDIGLVQDTFQQFPQLPGSTVLFVTGAAVGNEPEDRKLLPTIAASGARVERRKLGAGDLDVPGADEWYLCAGTSLKTAVLNWLAGKTVIYEDFSY